MWPEGIQCAVSLSFDLDAETPWIEMDPSNIYKPGTLSLARYGPKVAVPLILSLLKKHDIHSTFFIPGKVAEDHPERVSAIIKAGHEVAAHGYTHDSPTNLSHEDEEQQLVKSLRILKEFTPTIIGYRSPSWDTSIYTLDLLQKYEFLYSSNMMDDIKPYCHTGVNIIELPVQWILDDWVHFGFGSGDWTKKISTNSEVSEIWEAEFEGIYKLGGSFILTMHPQVIGRPSRLNMLNNFIRYLKSYEGVWITTCEKIARQVSMSYDMKR